MRAEGTGLTHALYQFLGAGIEPWLGELKPVQVKELKEAWEGMEKEGQGKGSLKPSRMTRQQAREAEEHAAAGGDDDAGEAPAEEGASLIIPVLVLHIYCFFAVFRGPDRSTRTGRGRKYSTQTTIKSEC